MLSSALRSKKAVAINIAIVRTFVRPRRMLASSDELARKVEQHDREIGVLFEHIQQLLDPPEPEDGEREARRIGFVHQKTKSY